jgi:tRNA pseudouridine55 synthase
VTRTAERGDVLSEVADGGFVIVDKPAGLTSHDVVARVRRLVGTRRVGHGGTLDPMATGVLVVGVDRGTRLLTYVIGSGKRYTATVRLGRSTLTDDAEGDVLAEADAGSLPEAAVRAGLRELTGVIQQVPSAVSAIKVDGRRSYQRVRAGEQVQLAARTVEVRQLDVLDIRRVGTYLDCDIAVACSSGTYIRALARDLGVGLGVGGHLTALRRTAVGSFTEADAVSLTELAERADKVAHGERTGLLPIPLSDAAGRCLPRRHVSDDEARVVRHGGFLDPIGTPGPYGVFDGSGRVLAIVRERDGRARPEAVLAAGVG